MVCVRLDHDAEEITIDAFADEDHTTETDTGLTDGIKVETSQDMRIGKDDPSGVQFKGEIHQTKFWQKYLTDSELSNEWCNGKGQALVSS